MNPKSILSRLKGVSVMGTGISVDTPEPEHHIAGRVISFMEDRRILFNDYELEVPDHCVRSVLEIREFLTAQVGELKSRNAPIADNLNGMRAACRKFLDAVQRDGRRVIIQSSFDGGPESWKFFTALGELRATIGLHLAILASQHGVSIDGDLTRILPPDPGAV